MVAPTRTPQARGVKCNLCKKILLLATWLDQTKLAKNIEDPQTVLNLLKQHDSTECPCIPNSIQNLLVGSTHFEIHRLLIKRLDLLVNKKQHDFYLEAKQKALTEQSKRSNETINDCNEYYKTSSRFNTFSGYNDTKYSDKVQQLVAQQLKHLSKSIDFWKIALEDQANPFNDKLALRLGLTHHVIYATYLYKYYKIFDYQLITANLLLNLFKSIEGVTTNAIVHANYILIKTLIDCNQIQAARQCLKQAMKQSNQDKSHYESILLACVSCELSLLENKNSYDSLEELAGLAIIKPDDKLQHYYARTLALSIVIRYMHYYKARSDLCFEYYHIFRYLCAIIRRCYENCFELVILNKELSTINSKHNHNQQQQQLSNLKQSSLDTQSQNQILDHSWIRYAVCDFVFNTFDLISKFYLKSGQPEALELLYNGLNLVAHRNGCYYWQSRMASIGVELDLLCDKYDQAKLKVDILSRIIGNENDKHLMTLLRLNSEISLLSILDREKETVIKIEMIKDLLQRIRCCHESLAARISQIELYDCKFKSLTNDEIILGNNLDQLSLKVFKIGIISMLKNDNLIEAHDLMRRLANQLKNFNEPFEYFDCHTMLEILVHFADIDKSEQILLESIKNSHLFLVNTSSSSLETKLSSLTLNSEKSTSTTSSGISNNTKISGRSIRLNIKRMSLRHNRKKGIYDVATKSEENLYEGQSVRMFDTIEAVKNFNSLTKEEIVVAYLRNSEPNPDYSLYRKAHELMFSFRLKDENFRNQDHLLYHFCESNTSNTMRYRWMMFEEQQVSPFDPHQGPLLSNDGKFDDNKWCSSNEVASSTLRHLSFKDILVNPEKISKSMIQLIPNDTRFTQLKYIIEQKSRKEHLLIVCFDNKNEPFYIHTEKQITSDDFFKDAIDMDSNEIIASSIPNRISKQIDSAKKSLFIKSQRDRNDRRKNIEKQIGDQLNELENDWLGPFRIIFVGGKIQDSNYEEFIQKIEQNLIKLMEDNNHICLSESALRFVIENCPIISRYEFNQLFSILFSCPISSDQIGKCFKFWLKSFESHLEKYMPNTNKESYLFKLNRGQLGIIMDKNFELLPIESLPIVRVNKQAIFRVPSLRLFYIMATRNINSLKLNTNNTVYILDPANNLAKTRERFETKLKSHSSWSGSISQPPKNDELEKWLMEKDIYIFIGHGAGTVYYNKLCKNKGLSSMPYVKPLAIVMGCSSGRVLAEGPRLESFGINWVFIFRGSPAYVGLLWDVTDTDIDKFLESFLNNWMGSNWTRATGSDGNKNIVNKSEFKSANITNALAQARQVCEYRFLIGSTPVIYGLPVSC